MFARNFTTLIATAVLLFAAATAHAETLLLQDGANGIGSDGTVFFAGNYSGSLGTGITRYANYDYGGQSNMAVTEAGYINPGNAGPTIVRALVYFDLASIGTFHDNNPDYQLTGAKLKLYQQNIGGTDTVQIGAYQIFDANAGWGVGVGNGTASGGDPIAGAATWNYQSADGSGGGTAWPAGGNMVGYVAGSGYGASPLATTLFDQATPDDTEYSFDIDTDGSLLDHWINNTNAGLIIRGDTGTNVRAVFWTPQRGTATLRPALEITYDVIPEPGSIALLAFGSVILLRRRSAK